VVLFTSGSENLPKAVPLTHENLLTNVRDMIQEYDFHPEERILGMLPPFHSFGLTCTMVLPLCTGMKAVYYPVPTDGVALARHIEAYRVTALVGTPTFLNGIVRVARTEQLDSLKFVISGAEKCPETLFAAIQERWPAMVILEGYGITECSPVVAANREERFKHGTIGSPMPSVIHAIVDAETSERALPGAMGMLLVRGLDDEVELVDVTGANPPVALHLTGNSRPIWDPQDGAFHVVANSGGPDWSSWRVWGLKKNSGGIIVARRCETTSGFLILNLPSNSRQSFSD